MYIIYLFEVVLVHISVISIAFGIVAKFSL